MYDSLVLANTIELLDGGVISANPACPGAMFRLQPGADPGAPQPTTDFVASLLLDGERPFGRRASNRTVKLPIWVTAPNRAVLAAARELLQQTIDQDYFTITWTRDPYAGNPGNLPLPMLLDCFRAQPTVPVFNTLFEKELCGVQVQVTIPALPYGRSATQTQISFSSPAPTSPNIPPPPAPVTLDNFATISSAQCSRSSQCVIGPYTCCWDPDAFGDPGGQNTPLTYGSAFPAPLNLTDMTSLQMWFGLGSRYYANLDFPGKTHGVSVAVKLTDSSGGTLSFARTGLRLPVSNSAQAPAFTRVTIPVPQNSVTFNYASVAAYALTVTNRSDRVLRLSEVTAYLDALTAYPGSQYVSPVTRGAVYTIYQVAGTARAPVSMAFQQPPTAGTPTTITATGPGTYTVPSSTAYLKVECTGGGGAGAGRTSAGQGAGAGGAEYAAELVFPASAGQVIPYVNGVGDSPGASPPGGQQTVFGPAPGGTLQVIANGGGSVATNGTSAGAGGSGSVNSVEYPGGAGRANPAGTYGGGGGSSAGPSSAGNTPMGSGSVLFTTAGTYTGSGSGWLCPAGVFQVLAECWGGGGGAASGGTGENGAGGGGGEYRNALVSVTPGTYYTIVVPPGGAGGTGAGNGSAGGQASFAGDSYTVIAKGGSGGQDTGYGGGGTGGHGGTGTTGYNGGAGGNAYPYTGGGGSSAGPYSQGNTGGSPGGAVAPAQGGAGGNGSGANNGAGTAGTAPGGGGGGSYYSSYGGGAGAAGQVRLTYPATTGAPTSAGGTAVAGGGAGGAGGATAGSAGSAGSAPGGGGGGADSSGTTVAGGGGGNGQIKITPYSPAAFKSLIVHRPPLGAAKTFQPMVSVGGGSDAPDGTHQYTMPQPVTGVNSDFSGTYTVYLVNSSWSGGSGSTTPRVIYVTVTQYEYAGGPGYSVATLPVTVSPSQVTNGILCAGVLTLPPKAVAPDNIGGYYTVSPTDSNTGDRFWDCLFLDTMGQCVVLSEPSQAYTSYYIDAPDPNVSLGRIMGSSGGRPDAISVMDNCQAISGGPLYVEPADGDNQLFVYCADGSAPNVSLSYYACYYFDRTQ